MRVPVAMWFGVLIVFAIAVGACGRGEDAVRPADGPGPRPSTPNEDVADLWAIHSELTEKCASNAGRFRRAVLDDATTLPKEYVVKDYAAKHEEALRALARASAAIRAYAEQVFGDKSVSARRLRAEAVHLLEVAASDVGSEGGLLPTR